MVGQVAGAVTVAIVAYLLAQKVDLKETVAALGYGVVTAIVVLALDFLITKRFNPDFNPFAVNMVIGYAVIVLVPQAVKMQKK